jgi:hypothetical protein
MISTDFNNSLKLVRDQGVGGSNPLSPTNYFQYFADLDKFKNRPSGCSPGSLVSEGASFLGFSLNSGCSDSYKIVYSQIEIMLVELWNFWFFEVLSSTIFLGPSPHQFLSILLAQISPGRRAATRNLGRLTFLLVQKWPPITGTRASPYRRKH